MTVDLQPRFARIARELADQGWSVDPDFLPAAEVGPLRERLREWWEEGEFRRAAVGRGAQRRILDEVRGDHVRWIDFATGGRFRDLCARYWEPLRLAVNQHLLLGLFSLEGHVTVYPPGSFYVRHLDRFQGATHRTLSAILYLNEDWTADDGGELRLYMTGPGGQEQPLDVLPRAGTLVTFLSASMWHEVLPTRRERLSFTTWFSAR